MVPRPHKSIKSLSYQRLYKCRRSSVWWLDLGEHSRPRCIPVISFSLLPGNTKKRFSQKLQKERVGYLLFWLQEELVTSHCTVKRGYSWAKPCRICDLLRFHIFWGLKEAGVFWSSYAYRWWTFFNTVFYTCHLDNRVFVQDLLCARTSSEKAERWKRRKSKREQKRRNWKADCIVDEYLISVTGNLPFSLYEHSVDHPCITLKKGVQEEFLKFGAGDLKL